MSVFPVPGKFPQVQIDDIRPELPAILAGLAVSTTLGVDRRLTVTLVLDGRDFSDAALRQIARAAETIGAGMLVNAAREEVVRNGG